MFESEAYLALEPEDQARPSRTSGGWASRRSGTSAGRSWSAARRGCRPASAARWPTRTPPTRRREETFRLLLYWLHGRAARGPLLFAVEDPHWADASTLEFLGKFVAESQADRVLAVFTFRPEFEPSWPAADHQTPLALTRLTRRQVADLVRTMAGCGVPDEVIEPVYDRAGEVPLFVEEFTKMVRESDAGRSRASRPAGLGYEMSSTPQDLVMARLDPTEGGQELAQLAAVLGREFSHELLAAVAVA